MVETAELVKTSVSKPIRQIENFGNLTNYPPQEHHTQLTGPLYLSEDIENPVHSDIIPSEDLEYLRVTLEWTRGFIMKPHSQLGRRGHVCPFVKQSVEDRLLYLSVCHLEQAGDIDEIYRHMLTYRDLFLETLSSKSSQLESLIIIFPEIEDEVAEALMEPLHKRLKTELLSDGLMIGQFYPTCTVPATLNPKFMVLQSPLPMFVLRRFIESDWRFLEGNPTWETYYRQTFQPHVIR